MINILLLFINILLKSLLEMINLLGVIIAVGFILGFLEKSSNTILVRTFGPKGVLVTALIGTPIHEIGHLIQCFVWGHRVTRVRLLQLHHPTGVLGFVEHQYNRNSMYQQIGNFFIGIGPLFSGIGCLLLSMYFLIPSSYFAFQSQILENITIHQQYLAVFKTAALSVFVIGKSFFTLENLLNPFFWMFSFIAISVSSHMALSKPDIHGSAKGLFMIFFVVLVFNIVSSIFQIDTYQIMNKLASYNAYVAAFSGMAIFFSFITLIVSVLLFKLKRILHK